ncbi:hypothetical protein AWB77_01482 [Caballeronia fortuita]|uniref:PLD phosphodiesterase domain-containing protein n=1 Tax=Caballeronia fortuita TaxID=1777138 RepID=A0A158A7V9_9BURK|nr:phospholipase D family protein [Caballeronia fortuita]SAK53922.1 hypothetical protein AWB77_01482 [Caballeronia fortuita]
MLKLESDRLDYGDQMRAPPGYALHSAVATTFSLDLETLAAASLSLTLDQTLEEENEGELSGERVALLESIDQLQKRLMVFYQRGNIKVPNKFNRLFTLLEPLLVPVVALEGADGAFASFHPKVWLLRFSALDEDGPDKWRLLVLSRNLTFDRSWDLAVSIDGETARRGNGDPRLIAFLRSLAEDPRHTQQIEAWCDALGHVAWTAPDQFDPAFEVLPGSHGDENTAGVPVDLPDRFGDLLVMSPFIDADEQSMLAELASRTRDDARRTLISRGDTLDKIGKDALEDWDCLSLSERVVDGEERHESRAPEQQNLHAKLIVAKHGTQAVWHVGSANMTNAAFGQPGKLAPPRNRELMLRLTGRNSKVGPDALLAAWKTSNVFQKHEFREGAPASPEEDSLMRRAVHALSSAEWLLHVKEEQNEPAQFDLRLEMQPDGAAIRLPGGYEATVRLLCRDDPRALGASLTWTGVSLTDISAFLPVEIVSPTGLRKRFVVQAALSVDLLERRKGALFRDIVGDGKKLLRYLALILDLDPSRTDWTRADGNGQGADVFGLDGKGALYEQLLRAASRAPRRMSRAIDIYRRVRAEIDTLPEGLDALFDSFAAYHQERNA